MVGFALESEKSVFPCPGIFRGLPNPTYYPRSLVTNKMKANSIVLHTLFKHLVSMVDLLFLARELHETRASDFGCEPKTRALSP